MSEPAPGDASWAVVGAGADPALDRFAPFYDLEYGAYTADLDLYRAYAATAAPHAGARVLELACGTGRVLLALAAAGHHCTGVDASAAMLAIAAARAARAGLSGAIRLVAGRMETLPADAGAADLALCALNSFAYLPDQATQLAALAGVHARLAPGGQLVLDLTPLDPGGPFPTNGELVLQGSWLRPGGGRVLKFVSGAWDPAAQQHHVHWIYDEEDAVGQVRRTTIPQTLRYTYRWEAELLLAHAGFVVEAVYGSYDLDPYEAGSPRLILTARAAPARAAGGPSTPAAR